MAENLTDSQKRRVDLSLTSLNAYVPNLAAIRESLNGMRDGDPKAAYEHFLLSRPAELAEAAAV